MNPLSLPESSRSYRPRYLSNWSYYLVRTAEGNNLADNHQMSESSQSYHDPRHITNLTFWLIWSLQKSTYCHNLIKYQNHPSSSTYLQTNLLIQPLRLQELTICSNFMKCQIHPHPTNVLDVSLTAPDCGSHQNLAQMSTFREHQTHV